MALKEKMARLAELYTATGADWSLHIDACLTEPTCPCANVTPDEEEMNDLMRYAAWGDTIEEAAERALDQAYAELIEGRKIESDAPWTNPADHKFELWLANARKRLEPEKDDAE